MVGLEKVAELHLKLSCGVGYVPRLTKVVEVLAVRLVKQGTEATGFRAGSTLHSCQCYTTLH